LLRRGAHNWERCCKTCHDACRIEGYSVVISGFNCL